MNIPQFVKKLLDILENSNGTIQWNQDGTEFIINDSQKFAETLLSKYFRHNRFESFVRQLNMYGFSKICRRKDSINFRHQYFIKGMPENYELIKRKKKLMASQRIPQNFGTDIIKEIETNYPKFPVLPLLFQKLFKFKNEAAQLFKNVRQNMDALSKQLTTKKSKQIKPSIIKIRQTINYMQQTSHSLQCIIQKKREEMKNYQKDSQISFKVSSIEKNSQNQKQNQRDQKYDMNPGKSKGSNSEKRQKQNKNFSVQSFRSIGSFIS